MARPMNVRQTRAVQLRRLREYLDQASGGVGQRRAEAVLLHAEGMSATDIAHMLGVHANTIRADLHAFDQHGLSAVVNGRRPGAPAQLRPHQQAEICRLADQEPCELGLPYGRWSLAKLRSYLIRQRRVKKISRAHLARVLKKGGSGGGRSAAG